MATAPHWLYVQISSEALEAARIACNKYLVKYVRRSSGQSKVVSQKWSSSEAVIDQVVKS